MQNYYPLMKNILAYSWSVHEPGDVMAKLKDAVYCSSIIPQITNDMMIVGHLKGFTVSN